MTTEVNGSIIGVPGAYSSTLDSVNLEKDLFSPFPASSFLKLLECWKFQLGKHFTVGNSSVNPDVQTDADTALAESDVDRRMQSQLGK